MYSFKYELSNSQNFEISYGFEFYAMHWYWYKTSILLQNKKNLYTYETLKIINYW